jgi:hypothetical protein
MAESQISLNSQVFHQSLFCTFELFDFFLKVVDFCLLKLMRITVQSVNRLEQLVRILHFVLNQWPQLLKQSTQILRLLFCLLQFLVKQLFAISQQRNQLLVFGLEQFDLVQVAAFS